MNITKDKCSLLAACVVKCGTRDEFGQTWETMTCLASLMDGITDLSILMVAMAMKSHGESESCVLIEPNVKPQADGEVAPQELSINAQ